MAETDETVAPNAPETSQAAPSRLRKQVEYYKARYLVDPIRLVVRRARRRMAYVGRVMNQVSLATNPGTEKWNRVLDDGARIEYANAIRRVSELAPEALGKIAPGDDLRQAFVFEAVRSFGRRFANPRILFVGEAADAPAPSALARLGHQLRSVALRDLPTLERASFDMLVYSPTLENVEEGSRVLRDLVGLLAPAGVVILICAFRNDDRTYAKRLAAAVAPQVRPVDLPAWNARVERTAGPLLTTMVLTRDQDLDFNVRFETLTLAEQARFFEDNGFLVVPETLSQQEVAEALADLQTYAFKGTTEEIWSAPSALKLVTNRKIIEPLRATFGDDIRFVKGAYVETVPDELIAPERQRKWLHVDYGIGEQWGDFRNSTPAWVNVGVYLTGLTAEHSPLWVVPGSHRKLGVVPNTPMEYLVPEAKRVSANPGDAVIFHCRCVHAASYNRSSRTRHTYFYQYRPAWAKSAGPVPEWPETFVNNFSEDIRWMFRGLNKGL